MSRSVSRTCASACAALLLLAGCNANFGRDDLDTMMQDEVGRTRTDPESYRARHPNLRLGERALSNGHVEEAYRIGVRDNCVVRFEVDPASGKVVTWRFDVPDEDCILANPAEREIFDKQHPPKVPAKK